MPPDSRETLRDVNRNLRSAMARLRPEQTHCLAIGPQDFSDILRQLLRAAECLRHPPAHPEARVALAEEALEYRRNLEALKQFLPDLQGRLLAERARLETERSQVAAATAWAGASRKFL